MSPYFVDENVYLVAFFGKNGATPLLERRMRFTEIRNEIPKLSDRILTDRLREFEIHNIVKRIVSARIPVRVEYELTAKGKDTVKIFLEMKEWLKRNS